MQRPPPRSTRTDTLFPYTTPSDLNDVPRLAGQSVTCGVAVDQFQLAKRRVRNRGKPPHDRLADMRPNARVAQDRLQVGEMADRLEFAFECEDLPRLGSAKQRLFACYQDVVQRIALLHQRPRMAPATPRLVNDTHPLVSPHSQFEPSGELARTGD